MTPTADDLLNLLFDGECVAWEISRTPDGLVIVGHMQDGQKVHLATVPLSTNLIEDGQ